MQHFHIKRHFFVFTEEKDFQHGMRKWILNVNTKGQYQKLPDI